MTELARFREFLEQEEKSTLTVKKYLRDVSRFLHWLNGEEPCKRQSLTYKDELIGRYSAVSVNSIISSLNSYFSFIGRPDCRVKSIKQQRQTFLPAEKELSREEYNRLVQAAGAKPRLRLLIQTICSTGIRVSEHPFITVEAAKAGYADVQLKGKCRRVILPRKLCSALLKYAKTHGIPSGSIFLTSGGKPLDRSNIWAEMKKLCSAAKVSRDKVFPHNLRHLFARIFYGLERDIVRLADILGHSSINTTRIYVMESGHTHIRQMERMQILLTT